MSFLPSTAHPPRKWVVTWGIVVFAIGLCIRLVLALPGVPSTVPSGFEPVKIALSLLNTGRYADAYGAGSGPTAHCAPAYPVFLSLLFRIFGTGAGGARAMVVFSSAAAAAGFALLPVLAAVGGLSLTTGVLAGLAGALLPINFWSQTGGGFEAPFTSLVLVILCILVCQVWAVAQFSRSEGAVLGLVAGFGCLLSPSLIPILATWSAMAVFSYRHELRRVLPFLAVVFLVIVAMLAPWAIRNYRVLGAFIWTRSDFGLELQVSNNDLMTSDLEVNVTMPEFGLFHPTNGAAERAKVRTMGEVAYERAKKQQAFEWIASHKRRFLSLTFEHFRLFWLPLMHRPWQSVGEGFLTAFGLGGLALLFWKKYDLAWVAVPAFAVYPLVYYLIQSSGRYRSPVEPLLFLLGATVFNFHRMIRADVAPIR